MSDSSNITTKLSSDTSEYRSAMNDAVRFTGGIVEKIGHHFSSTRLLATTIATGLGLHFQEIASGLARLIIGFSEEQEEALKRVDAVSKSSADAQITAMRSLLNEEQKYHLALRERAAAQKRIAEGTPRQTEPEESGFLERKLKQLREVARIVAVLTANPVSLAYLKRLDSIEEVTKGIKKRNDLEAENQTVSEATLEINKHNEEVAKRAVVIENLKRGYAMDNLTSEAKVLQINREINEVLAQIVAGGLEKHQTQELGLKLDELEKENLKEQAKIRKDSSLTMSEEHELLLLQAKGLGALSKQEAVRYEVLKLIKKLREAEVEVENLLAIPAEKRTETEKVRLRYLLLHEKEIQKQIDLENALLVPVVAVTDATKAAVTANDEFVTSMGALFDEVMDVSKAWDDFTISVKTFGRGDKALTDSELSRKITSIRKDISARQAQDLTASGGAYYNPSAVGADGLLEAQRQALLQAQNEQRLRSDVRRNASAFGGDAAFQQYSGLTEQRFKDILAGGPGDATQQLVATMNELNQRLRKGIVTIPLPGQNGDLLQTGTG